jgi:hypothetical protein
MSDLSKRQRTDHSIIGGELILVGGILALIFPVFPLALAFLLRDFIGAWFERIGTWIMGSGNQSGMVIPHIAESILFFVAIGAIATIIFGAVAIVAYTQVRRGKVGQGGLAAILAGVAMVASLHWILGIITMIGGPSATDHQS